MLYGKKPTLGALALAAVLAGAQVTASETTFFAGKLAIDTLPFALESRPEAGAAHVKNKALVLQAQKGSDL